MIPFFADSSVVLTSNVTPVVTLDDAKDHLRILNNDEDRLLESYVLAAQAHVENEYGLVLVQRTGTATWNQIPKVGNALTFQVGPLVSVQSVSWRTRDVPGTWTTVSADLYALEIASRGYLHVLGDWQAAGAFQIRSSFTAGYAAGTVPADVILAIKLILADMWMKRENSVKQLPTAAEFFLRSHRIMPEV